jgi:histidine decarboxylase
MTGIDIAAAAAEVMQQAIAMPAADPTGHGVDPTGSGPAAVEARLQELEARMEAAGQPIGFPASRLVTWTRLAGLFTGGLINNPGDPDTAGLYPRHVKDLEGELIGQLADLFRAPADDRWGYVTSGATEGILWAMRLARRRMTGLKPIVLYSSAAHVSVPDAVDTLDLPSIVLAADEHGELDYTDLETQVAGRRDRAIIVVATAGTTWTEAVDDVRRITAVLDRQQIPAVRRFVLVDAAFAGIPLALLDPNDRPGFDFADGASAVIVSSHKFVGSSMPGGAVLTLESLVHAKAPVGYIGAPHTTLLFSRNGQAVIAFWYAVNKLGWAQIADIAADCRDVARYLHARLTAIGWNAWRNPHAMTVTLDAPPELVRARHRLADIDGHSHMVCGPGITRSRVDTVIADLTAATRRPDPSPAQAPSAPAGPAATPAPAAAGALEAPPDGRRILPRPRRRGADAPGAHP